MADVDQLLRAVFEVCEATEDIEPKNDFERGRVFEAKHIRRGVGTWFQDTFCGRTHMGEPVIPTGVAMDSTEQALGLYAEQALAICDLLDQHAPFTTGNLQTRIAQLCLCIVPPASGVPGTFNDQQEQPR